MSYSRLMALGLSGGFIASAINMIAGMISGSWVGMIFYSSNIARWTFILICSCLSLELMFILQDLCMLNILVSFMKAEESRLKILEQK